MYKELIEELRTTERICRDRMDGEVMLRAADAIERLEVINEHYENIINKHERINGDLLEKAKAMQERLPRWIPVTDEPPFKVGDDGYNGYLVYANGYYEVADYTTDKFDNVPSFHVNGEYEPDVTHYMPLPEPPKEETE